MKHAIRVLLLGLCLTLPALAWSADEDDPDEMAAHTRHALMELVGWNMKEIVAMSTGRQDFDAARAALLGQRLGELGAMIADAFARDTSGADVKTAALPAVWQNADDFSAKTQDLLTAAAAYSAAAAEGQSTARRAFIELGGACKGCHENFKAED